MALFRYQKKKEKNTNFKLFPNCCGVCNFENFRKKSVLKEIIKKSIKRERERCRTESEKLEATYNRPVKILCTLPYATHRYFIEDVTEQQHPKKTVMERFLNFINSVLDSPMSALGNILKMQKRM